MRRFIYNAKKTLKLYYQLHEIINTLREIIRDNNLYDKTNTGVIVCDTELEKAFNTNGIHVTELKSKIMEQLILVTEPLQGQLRAAWQRQENARAASVAAPAIVTPEQREETATTSKVGSQGREALRTDKHSNSV